MKYEKHAMVVEEAIASDGTSIKVTSVVDGDRWYHVQTGSWLRVFRTASAALSYYGARLAALDALVAPKRSAVDEDIAKIEAEVVKAAEAYVAALTGDGYNANAHARLVSVVDTLTALRHVGPLVAAGKPTGKPTG